MTLYSPLHSLLIGTNASLGLYKVAKEIDIIKSNMTKANHRKRQQLRRAMHRKYKRIKDLRDELHWKIINYLCKRYDHIYLPTFRSSRVVRNLTRSVSRKLYSLSHYRFGQRLIYKAKTRGVRVYRGTEAYTTQTCGKCGKLNKPDSRSYTCSGCGSELDRDVNAARNIMLRFLNES